MNVEFSPYIDYSIFCYDEDYVFALPLPKRLAPKFNIMYPFQVNLWMVLGIAVLVMSATFPLFAWISEVIKHF